MIDLKERAREIEEKALGEYNAYANFTYNSKKRRYYLRELIEEFAQQVRSETIEEAIKISCNVDIELQGGCIKNTAYCCGTSIAQAIRRLA